MEQKEIAAAIFTRMRGGGDGGEETAAKAKAEVLVADHDAITGFAHSCSGLCQSAAVWTSY